jgi:hypothetical protein
MSGFNFHDVGKTPKECLDKAGIEGLAQVVAFYMFSQAQDGFFYGSWTKAVHELWGEEAETTKFMENGIYRRLLHNKFRAGQHNGYRGWFIPASWTWEEKDPRRGYAPAEGEDREPEKVESGWKCGQCGHAFPNQRALEGHVKKKHPKTSNRQCRYCAHEAASWQQLGPHVKSEHPEMVTYDISKQCMKAVRSRSGKKPHYYAEELGLRVGPVSAALNRLARQGKLRRGKHGTFHAIRVVKDAQDKPQESPKPEKKFVIQNVSSTAPVEATPTAQPRTTRRGPTLAREVYDERGDILGVLVDGIYYPNAKHAAAGEG